MPIAYDHLPGDSSGFGGGGSLGGLLNRISIGDGAGGAQWEMREPSTGLRGTSGGAGEGAGGSYVSRSAHSTSNYGGYSTSSPFPPSPQSIKSTSATSRPPSLLPTEPRARDFPPPLAPRSYTVLKEVGDGSFGTVWLADWHSPLQLPPGTLPPGPSSRPEYKGKKLVAIKRMKKAFEGGWDECMKLKELKSLRQIPMHANIIPLYDAFLLPSSKELYFVFECMEGNLYQLTKSRKGRPLASGLTASIFHQILAGLDHIHVNGYFHRDMKPENLLITTTGLADYPASSLYALPGTPPEKDVVVVVKLADFGLARETSSKPPYTEYVSTRWYRAPEVLLRSRDYSNPVDMWALGTILVEIITLKPLFPGDSEVDQVFKICEVLGDPSPDYGVDERRRVRGGGPWSKGVKMAKGVGFAFPKVAPRTLSSLFDTNTVSTQLIDCIADLLRYDPKSRLTTTECLDHAYFREVAYRFAPYSPSTTLSPSLPPTPTSVSFAASIFSNSTSASTRPLPSAHTNGFFKPPFQTSDPSRPSLPSPANGFPDAPSPSRHYSFGSGSIAGMSAYGIQLPGAGDYDSPMHSPDDLDDRRESFPVSANSHWGGAHGDPNWGPSAGPSQQRDIPAFGTHLRRDSLAESVSASTFYDGSIFEGIAPTRASSIMSFPVGYSTLDNSEDATAPPSNADRLGRIREGSAGSGGSQQVHLAPPAPSVSKSRGWGFGSVFSSDKNSNSSSNGAPPPPSQQPTSLKRTPSSASVSTQESAVSQAPLDPKKAKKEAERAAKEAEKAKREALQQASRERARAVMKKKSQLMEAADPLNSFSNHTRSVGADKGKARASNAVGQGSSKMPQIVEDTSRLQVSDPRYKARRRDEDEDVHSVSSNDTGHSLQRGRAYSISSQATSASDPGKGPRPHRRETDIPRAPSLSSIGSSAASSARVPHHSHFYSRAPNTGHSSLDHQLVQNMQGLATNGDGGGWKSPAPSERSDSRGVRASSPREPSDTRYSPYPHPFPASRGSGQGLPPISPFAEFTAASQFHPGRLPSQANQSSAASIASYHSTPGVLPSHYRHQLYREDSPQLPYLPTMDLDSMPSSGTTFPASYTSPHDTRPTS